MRKIIGSVLMFIGMGIALNAQNIPELKTGDKITYNVSANDKEYQFIMVLTELNKGIKFTWSMTDPINKQGSITISETALRSATKYHNYFKPEDKVLEDASSVFLSEANFKDLQKKQKTTMDMQDGNIGVWNGGYPDNFGFTYKGNDVSPPAYYLGLDKADPYKEVVVLAQGKYHLILSMSLGWNIRINSID